MTVAQPALFTPAWHAELELAYARQQDWTRPMLRRHLGPLRVQKHLHAEGHAYAHPRSHTQPEALCYPRTYRNPGACCYRNTGPEGVYPADGGRIPADAADRDSGYQRRRACPADRRQKAQQKVIPA